MTNKHTKTTYSTSANDNDAHTSNLIDIYRIGQRICEAREKAGLTQQQLGQAVGLTWVTISQIENGKRTQLNPKRMREIAKALGKTEAYIYDFCEPDATTHLSCSEASPILAEAWEEVRSLSLTQQTRIAYIIKGMLSLQRIE
jgi:transcriptional regulator with XRE-family HTH domain